MIGLMAMHPGLRRALHDGLAADRGDDWRPLAPDAQARARAYVQDDISADRSTISTIDEFDALTEQ
jgi:hypothetical protein